MLAFVLPGFEYTSVWQGCKNIVREEVYFFGIMMFTVCWCSCCCDTLGDFTFWLRLWLSV